MIVRDTGRAGLVKFGHYAAGNSQTGERNLDHSIVSRPTSLYNAIRLNLVGTLILTVAFILKHTGICLTNAYEQLIIRSDISNINYE